MPDFAPEHRVVCSIKGCARSRAGKPREEWICSVHWRALVPPRSLLRRAYHRHQRRGRAADWSPETRRAFWRFWDLLVLTLNRRVSEGSIDTAEINRMFGFDDD